MLGASNKLAQNAFSSVFQLDPNNLSLNPLKEIKNWRGAKTVEGIKLEIILFCYNTFRI